MICLYDGVKPIKNLVNKIIVGCFIQFYVLCGVYEDEKITV